MKRILIFLVCAAALAAGCTRSELQADDALAAQGKVRVSMTVKATESPIVATKADLQTADEALVGNLWVFVCQADGTLVEGSKVESFNPDTNQGDVVLKSGTDLTIYAFANVTNAVATQLTAWAANPTGVTSAQLEALTIGYQVLTDTPLPMWGKDPGVTINSSKVDHEIALTRSCARFDAAVAAAGDGVDDFVLERIVWVGGAADKATLYPAANSPVVPSDTISYAPHNALQSSAYAFEKAAAAEANALYVLVKGEYKGIVGYYKLAVRYDDAGVTKYDVKRNTIYSFTIKKINAPGFATTTEAAANKPQNVGYDVAVTDVDAHDLMVSNGQYYLALTNSEFVAYSADAVTVVLTTVMHNADASKVTTAGTVDVRTVFPANSLTFVDASIPVAENKVDVIGRLAANFQSAILRIRLGNLYQEVVVRRTASLAGSRSVVSDFSGADYVVAEKTAATPWLQLGTNASTFVVDQKINNPSGGVYVRADPNTTALRNAELYLGRKSGGRVKAYMEQPVPWLQVGNLIWATGNLIATGAQGTAGLGGCTIGSPTDGGLYFQFGSLIGYKGGKAISGGSGQGVPDFALTDDIVGWNGSGSLSWSNDAMVWPIGYRNTTGWVSGANDNAAYFGSATPPYETIGKQLFDFPGFVDGSLVSSTVAVGDPCRYYLGDLWRLPSDQEYAALFRWKGTYSPGSFNVGSWGSPSGNGNPTLAAVNAPSYTGTLNSAALGRGIYTNTLAGAAAAADPNALFFPAAGYRRNTTGMFAYVGRIGYYWSNSIHNNDKGFAFNFSTISIHPQGTENRAFGYSVRCVADALVADRTNVVIPLAGGSETINVSAFNGASWTAVASGAGLSVSSTSGTGNGSITISYPLLASGCRAGTVKLTSGSTTVTIAVSQRTINPPSASYHIMVNGLKWATGNLVAVDNCGCKVGASTDHGLYFQFGSLIGWKGGALANGGTGVGVNPYTLTGTQWWGGTTTNPGTNIFATDAMVWPASMVGKPAGWPNANAANKSTLSDYYFNYSVTPWATDGADIRNFIVPILGDLGSGTLADGRYAPLGVGDPCTYYLGAPWRQPTAAEYSTLFNGAANGTVWGSVAGWAWQVSPVGAKSNDLFFPASGYRVPSAGGAFQFVGPNGFSWSSSVANATNGYYLTFHKDNVYPQFNYHRSYGMPVRCVSSVP